MRHTSRTRSCCSRRCTRQTRRDDCKAVHATLHAKAAHRRVHTDVRMGIHVMAIRRASVRGRADVCQLRRLLPSIHPARRIILPRMPPPHASPTCLYSVPRPLCHQPQSAAPP